MRRQPSHPAPVSRTASAAQSLNADAERSALARADKSISGKAYSRRHARLERAGRLRRRTKLSLVVVVVLALGLAGALCFLVTRGATDAANNAIATEEVKAAAQNRAPTEEEVRFDEALRAGAATDDPNIYVLPTPLIATEGDLVIHSPICPEAITEIEFHQASYDTALQLTPLVSIVDAEAAADKRGTSHTPPDEQPTGDVPLIAQAVSTLRLDSVGPEMSSVDVGAQPGTVVYAPVTGTVVKIKQYSLFGLVDDYELHIQNPAYPGFDIVILHIDNLSVKVGDKVFGGCTRIAKVRDIGEIIDNNLSNFTQPGDLGNHCHVQVNDATREDYKGLEGALNIFSRVPA